MDLNFLPLEYTKAFEVCELDKLYEIRLRVGYPIKAFVENKFLYLTKNGYTLLNDNAIVCKKEDIRYIIKTVTENSEYAHNDKIKRGYLITKNGIRIGIAGECVFEDYEIITIKNISSLNIRIPHDIDGCTDCFFDKILNVNTIYDTLIISNPFLGKTTMLKDLIKKLNKRNIGNILIIDERGEFSNMQGENIDGIKFSNKKYAFDFAVRSLSPKIVVTDELSTFEDWKCVETAINSGVKIVASCHATNEKFLQNKEFFKKGLFERYVILSSKNEIGQVESVKNGEFNTV